MLHDIPQRTHWKRATGMLGNDNLATRTRVPPLTVAAPLRNQPEPMIGQHPFNLTGRQPPGPTRHYTAISRSVAFGPSSTGSGCK